MDRTRWTRPYQLLIIAMGAVILIWSVSHLRFSELGMRFAFMSLITLGIGSRISVNIPHTKEQISVSDIFIFLSVMLFGKEAAVFLAAADGLSLSARVSKKPITISFNVAVYTGATYLAATVAQLCFGSLYVLRHSSPSVLVLGVCLMALVHYSINSGTVATAAALKSNQPIWLTYKEHFLWSAVTSFAGASAAGLIIKLIDSVGFYALLAATPIIGVIYFTYWTYMKRVEASVAQAEQAQRHVAALRESEERFRSAFDHAAGMALVGADGRWLQVNRSLCQIVGYSEEELLATNFQAITHTDDLENILGEVNRLIEGETSTFQMEQRYLHKHKQAIWVLLSVTSVRNSQSDSIDLIFQIQDITDRKRAEEQLLHDAFHDVLTGLPNRALFMDHLKLSVERARRRPERLFAVLFLDFDRFKLVNDSLGHMVGDQLLVGIARRLETCLRPGDTIARLGGDEFTILLEDINHASEAIEVAERLQHTVSQPFNLNRHEVFTSASIGIALSAIGYERAEDVLRDADTAMYRAKMLGKARHEVFDKAMHSRALNLLQLETDLRRAVERREFTVNYQPIVSIETSQIRGFEALVRWKHPERGFISPIDFIPIAEETGLIVPIGRFVLEEACRQIQLWQGQFPQHPPLQVSVNLSGKQFMQADLIDEIKEVLDLTGIDPRSLKLEITESMVMDNIESAVGMLNQLRLLGIELSIDDFGTGYSSLSYLHRFPISTLKIDRSFVTRMTSNNENAEIVRTIVMLARNLKMDVVAEGVETLDQLSQLQRLNCEYGQGYLFSKPVEAYVATQLLSDHNADYLNTELWASPALQQSVLVS